MANGQQINGHGRKSRKQKRQERKKEKILKKDY